MAEHGPSEKAVEVAARAIYRSQYAGEPSDTGRAAALYAVVRSETEAAIAAAHDPTLGMDRSVCLQDVYDVLSYAFHPQNPTDWHPADVVERAFAESSSPDREGPAMDCPGCGAPDGYPPAGPCKDHGTMQAVGYFDDEAPDA